MKDIVTIRRAMRLYAEGASLREVGSATGLSHTGVRWHLINGGIDRRDFRAKRGPGFELVLMRANGLSLSAISSRIGIDPSSISERLRRLEARGDLSALLRLTPLQLSAYRDALDCDRLPHPDALELALEYDAQEAA